jgi:predicted ATPase
MITKLRVLNLKAWGEQLWDSGIELAPITLLLGPNSAGKTSLLQVPLLLKQTVTAPDPAMALNLGGRPTDVIDLGQWESVIHEHDVARDLGLGLTVQEGGIGSGRRPVDYSVTFRTIKGSPVLQRLAFTCGGRTFAATRHAEGDYRLEAPGYPPAAPGQAGFQPDGAATFSAAAFAAFGGVGPEAGILSERVRRQVGRVVYLGPLRQPPERRYRWEGVEPADLGRNGEHAVQALLASDNAPDLPDMDQEERRHWLVQRVSDWLVRLGVADGLKLAYHADSQDYEVLVERGGRQSNLKDVGFGVSQVLPILILAHTVPPGTTIVAEQPDSHLHPRSQAGLAELMVAVARERHVQFLVETHSEHVFRRLQTLMADETLSPEACRFYMADRKATGQSALVRLDMDEFGRVRNWPKHFFGDTVGETERQTRWMLERLAQRREKRPE